MLRREWAPSTTKTQPLEAKFQNYDNRFVKADERERAWLRHAGLPATPDPRAGCSTRASASPRSTSRWRAWYAERPTEPPVVQGTGVFRGFVVMLQLAAVPPPARDFRWLDCLLSRSPSARIRVVPARQEQLRPDVRAPKPRRAPAARPSTSQCIRLALLCRAAGHPGLFAEFLRDRNVLPHDPLDGREGERRLLVIFFDGLDELAMQGRAAQEVARSFVESLIAKLDNLNDPSREPPRLVQVIIGGRDIAVQAVRLPPEKVLHVLPYHGSDPATFSAGQKLLKRADGGRDLWWRKKYGALTGEGYRGLPRDLKAGQSEDITAQPLPELPPGAQLPARAAQFHPRPEPERGLSRACLDAVYERPWGDGEHPAKRQLTKLDFHNLLDELSLAAWHGEGRTVTETTLVEACLRAGLSGQLERF